VTVEARLDITFLFDHGQVYLYDRRRPFSEGWDEYLQSLDEANAAKRSVGVLDGFVNILMATQYNFHAPLSIEAHDGAPEPGLDGYDHVVEFDLALPSGVLVLDASGGAGEVEAALPADTHRMRWSATGLDAAEEAQYEVDRTPDRYRLQLWPAVTAEPPRELKRWAGYDRRFG
jgi:hypothetical protein